MTLSQIIVLSYFREFGADKPSKIARACNVTERTVYGAVSRIREIEAATARRLLPGGALPGED